MKLTSTSSEASFPKKPPHKHLHYCMEIISMVNKENRFTRYIVFVLLFICTLFAFTGCANDTTIPPSGSSTSSPPEDPAIQWADPVIKHIISTAYLDKTVEDEFEKQIDLGVLT